MRYTPNKWTTPELIVLQLPKFKAEATDLIGSDGIEALAVYLIDHPDAGDVIQDSGGARKLRWAVKGKGKRGGARIILRLRRDRRAHLLTPLLCKECQNESDRG